MAEPIPIAIVGMSFRGPGGADNPEKLWDLIHNGKNAWSPVPTDRWEENSHWHPDIYALGSHNQRGGHFIEGDISEFDANFFSIQGAEADSLDPQQRLMLELSYEAFENAGITVDELKGSDTCVFTAAFVRDYEMSLFSDEQNIPVGYVNKARTNKIADLMEAIHNDWCCLVALHRACQSLRARESSLGLVGGTNLILDPKWMKGMAMSRVLNDDGKCYTFDHRGSGYGRGEGVACIVLKRLDDAIQDGDPIRAVIRNTGTNQDGKTNGIALPNQEAQERLIRKTYAEVKLDPKQTTYVEAHGTGTIAGDLKEVAAIANTFNVGREGHLYIGSVKTNIGHLESTSGVAGVIKTVLVLEKGIIPPHANFEKFKDGLDFDQRKLKLAFSPTALPEAESGLRRASVNSFGYGGTNAHVIVEAPQREEPRQMDGQSHVNGYANKINGTVNGNIGDKTYSENYDNSLLPQPKLFVISAKSQNSLLGSIEKTKSWLTTHQSELDLKALSKTLLARRSLFNWHASFVATSSGELLSALTESNLRLKKEAPNSNISFVFTGQGAQWYAMGRELILRPSVFQESIRKSEDLLTKLGASWKLTEVLLADEKSTVIDRSDVAQPVSTAVQLALVDLLSLLNILPSSVVGHSSGEIAAAYAAGALTHTTAMIISYNRGFTANAVKRSLETRGAMLAVGLSEKEALAYVKEISTGRALVACVNSPKSVTISGDEVAIEELEDILKVQTDSIFYRRLKVDTAYHSHHMAVVAEEYLQSMESVEIRDSQPHIKFFSSVSGDVKSTNFGPQYWVDNLLGQVKFSAALTNLAAFQQSTASRGTAQFFIEIGPHSALFGPIRQCLNSPGLDKFKYDYLSALLRNTNALSTVLEMTGKLFESGYAVSLKKSLELTDSLQSPVVTDLYPYSWDHSKKYWCESRISHEYRHRKHPNHDILGLRILAASTIEPIWRNILKSENLPWMRDHVVEGQIVFPGAGYMCMALEAIRQINLDRQVIGVIKNYKLRDISLSRALIIPDGGSVEVQLTLKPTANKWEAFRIFSKSEGGSWNEHCQGLITAEFEVNTDEVEGLRESDMERISNSRLLDKTVAASTQKVNGKALYDLMTRNGNYYGPSFATVDNLYHGDKVAHSTVSVFDVASLMPSQHLSEGPIQPATLDAIFHLDVYLFNKYCGTNGVMPVHISDVSISADFKLNPGEQLNVVTTFTPEGARAARFNSHVFQGNRAIISVTDAELKAVGQSQQTTNTQPFSEHKCFEIEWEPDVDFIPRGLIMEGSIPPLTNIPRDDQVRLLETAASYYVQRALKELDETNFLPSEKHHIALVNWMRKYKSSDEFQLLIQDEPNLEIVLNKLDGSGVEIELLSKVAPYLSDIIKGQKKAIELMTEGNVLYRFYTQNMWSLQCNKHIGSYLRAASFKNPHLKVLEVGAGTGSATIRTLEAVTRPHGTLFSGLTFTDISSGFFDKARETLAEWSDIIEYKTLDIEKDINLQGFEDGAYDVIVASVVLHATKDLTSTLKNVHKLLKPGGRLVMLELTKVTAWINCIFGSTSGWWAGVEEGRVDSPLLSVEQWAALFKKTGFGDLEIATDALDWQASVLVASALPFKTDVAASESTNSLKILTSESVDANAVLTEFSSDLNSAFSQGGFNSSISKWTDSFDKDTIYLILDDGLRPLLSNLNVVLFKQITKLLTAHKVIWVSAQSSSDAVKNPEKGLLSGLQRVARAESGSKTVQVIDVQDTLRASNTALIKAISSLVTASYNFTPYVVRGVEPEYFYRNGVLLIPRLIPANNFHNFADDHNGRLEMSQFHRKERPSKLHIETPGLLDSMAFIEDTLVQERLGTDEIEIETRAFGINFKDVYIALGQMKFSDHIVGECSGTVTKIGTNVQNIKVGDRVCAWTATPFASHARVHALCAYTLPDMLSFEEAASIPIVFMTAYYGLVEKANLKRGQSVLIHAGAGGVGQAAIQIAHHIGAEIFVTVGSTLKKEMLVKQFGIPESHIFSTRTRNFKAGILRLTNSKGVNVVLNSLSGESLIDSWASIARHGTFLEIGKTDLYSNAQLNMLPFSRSATFAAYDLSMMANDIPAEVNDLMRKCLALFQSGDLKPVQPIITMPITNIEDAFRLIQARKHTGKVVLTVDDATMVKSLNISNRSTFDGRGTIVIAGGLGDLGRRISTFFASHGAKHIVALARNALKPQDAEIFKKSLADLGAESHHVICDITDASEVKKVAQKLAATLPPVKVIIQAAMVLQDTVLDNMNLDIYYRALNPKYQGTNNLITHFPEAENVVMFSSAATIVGNRGQGNYASGCSFQDRVATHSGSDAHIISINLPLIQGSDVDVVDDIRQRSMYKQGLTPITFDEFLICVDYALSSRCRDSGVRQLVVGIGGQAVIAALDGFGSAYPIFKHLVTKKGTATAATGDAFDRNTAHIGINPELNIDEVLERMTIAIANRISALVAIDYAEIELDTPILEFGLDSLVAIELKNWIIRTFQTTTVDTSEILGQAGIRALAQFTAERSSLVNSAAPSSVEVETNVDKPEKKQVAAEKSEQLPRQPLLDLDTLFEYFLANHRAIWSDQEYEDTLQAIKEFQEPDGIGRKLHQRLVDLASDPKVDNWLFEINTRSLYLDRRYSLLKSNIGGSHKLRQDNATLSQVEAAAVITIATLEYQQTLEAGKMEPDYLSELRLDDRAREWLFNSCREPRQDVDTTNKFQSNHILVVLYRGHVFKVELAQSGKTVTYDELKATFQAILNTVKDDSWVTILTAQERNAWAEIYHEMKQDEVNRATIELVERCSFIIALDDSEPTTPEERMKRFLLGDGFNRWYDKTVVYIVCKNGISGFLGEYSQIDGSGMASLNIPVVKALHDHVPDALSERAEASSPVKFEEYHFNVTPELDTAINATRKEFLDTVAPVDYRLGVFPFLGSTELSKYRLAGLYAWEIITQLASRLFFGYNPASWQPVSMEHYHHGRSDVIQTCTPIVKQFCDLASVPLPAGAEAKTKREQRKLFFKSVKDHANAVQRAQRGHAHDRTLTAMEWIRRPDEENPRLFKSDKGYWESRPRRIMTGISTGLFSDFGYGLMDPKSIGLVYDIQKDGAKFSIINAGGEADSFIDCVYRAGQIVRNFLD